jgi:hypothetical protein
VASGGRGSYYSSHDLEVLRREAAERLERSHLDAKVNSLLQDKLAAINDRDVEKVNERLDAIREVLADTIEEFERLSFGGSVAKHTWVDGLSDVDSLVLLKDVPADSDPETVRNLIKEALERRVPRGDIDEIKVGTLAVTVRYRDGEEIQLLPAIRRGAGIAISDATGRSWSSDIDPQSFARSLTETNQQQGRMVVPTVKLAKAIFDNKLGRNAPSGYHVEVLAVEGFRDYTGPRNTKAMLTHLVQFASENVLRPTRDITGQSIQVDESLGPANSSARQALARRIGGLAKTLETSRSLTQWRALLE